MPISLVILSLCSNELILELDFLCKHGALISCRTEELAITSFPSEDFFDSTDIATVSGSLSLQHTTTIPPSMGAWLAVVSSTAKKGPANMDIVTEKNQNVLLQKRVVAPTSLITLTAGQTSIWGVNFGYQACVLPAGLTRAPFFESPCLEAIGMLPLYEVSEGAVRSGVGELSHSFDDNLKQMLDARLTLEQQLEVLEIVRFYPTLHLITSNVLPVEHYTLNIHRH